MVNAQWLLGVQKHLFFFFFLNKTGAELPGITLGCPMCDVKLGGKKAGMCVYSVRLALGSPVAALPEMDGWYYRIAGLQGYNSSQIQH